MLQVKNNSIVIKCKGGELLQQWKQAKKILMLKQIELAEEKQLSEVIK